MPRARITPRLVSALVFAGAIGVACPAGATAPAFPGLVTTTVTSADGATPIPDAGSLIATLDVMGLGGRLVDVDVTVDIAHTQADNLDVSLVSPDGTTITLTSDNGGANDDVFAGTTFDDQAAGTPSAPNVRNFTYVDLTPTGPIQPEEALGALVGEHPNGLWALVVVDDTGGQTGALRGWSLALSTVPGLPAGAPVSFPGPGAAIPNNNLAGVSSPVVVSGLGPRVEDVNVTLDITHPNAADLDLFLTAPSGRRIDLVTDVGGGNDDLYRGTTFDDQAGTPVADLPLPTSGTAFTAVVPEGALAAFLGEDPNGTWTLTAVDDSSGNTGTLTGWTLTVRASTCGDGVVDPGEQCDDGNAVAGDGCEADCTPTPPGGCPDCATSEVDCGNCIDDDGNGLTDAADSACQATPGVLRTASLGVNGALRVNAAVPLAAMAAGAVELVLADGNGTVTCAALGALQPVAGGAVVAKGPAAGGRVTVKVKPNGQLAVRGQGVSLPALDDPHVTIAIDLGGQRFVGSGSFRARGRARWVYP
jgi:cysteine-rich repeat protein